MTGKFELGKKIRQIRELKKASVSDIANASHLSDKQLINIESGEQQPSLGVISRISAALGVRVGTFTDNTEGNGVAITRKCDCEIANGEGNINFAPLALTKDDKSMEPSIITIDPSSQSEVNKASHEGEEFIYVLDGTLSLEYGSDVYTLNTGDSIYMDSVIEHRISSANNQCVKAISVIYMPL